VRADGEGRLFDGMAVEGRAEGPALPCSEVVCCQFSDCGAGKAGGLTADDVSLSHPGELPSRDVVEGQADGHYEGCTTQQACEHREHVTSAGGTRTQVFGHRSAAAMEALNWAWPGMLY
jgi:hypothetical protein